MISLIRWNRQIVLLGLRFALPIYYELHNEFLDEEEK